MQGRQGMQGLSQSPLKKHEFKHAPGMKQEITKVDGNFDENQKFKVAENICIKQLTFDLMLFPHTAPTGVLVLRELLPSGRWGEPSRRPAPEQA